MSVTIKRIAYRGWPNCLRISNGLVDLIATLDVGPRIIRFGFVGGENEFKEFDKEIGKRGGKAWRSYGGHRLWHAPEGIPRSYWPDNVPVASEKHGGVLRLIQSVECATGLVKEIDIRLAPNRARVELVHRIRNTGHFGMELAPWALSVMAPGGVCISPLPPRGTHPEVYLPNQVLAIWPYTHLSDPRWLWGRNYILLRQDQSPKLRPQKIGAFVPDGWAAYAHNDRLFVKHFPAIAGATYPDHGCNFETFTNQEMLEIETLGILTTVAPGTAVEHTETWSLFNNIPTPTTEAGVNKHVLPKVKSIK